MYFKKIEGRIMYKLYVAKKQLKTVLIDKYNIFINDIIIRKMAMI